MQRLCIVFYNCPHTRVREALLCVGWLKSALSLGRFNSLTVVSQALNRFEAWGHVTKM